MHAIELEKLTRTFGTVRAVEGITLRVPEGSIFGFLGPNGSGKTTTIRLILGLLEPTGGRVQVFGHDAAKEPDRVRNVSGALLHQTGLYGELTAEDNLLFYARIWRLNQAERHERTRSLLRRAGLWERRGERVGTWSRGMQQRLALLRTLVHRPRLVLLDEPTAGLDVVAARSVRKELMRLSEEEGVTLFLTTHNMAEAEVLCDRVAVIRNGRLVAEDTPQTLKTTFSNGRIEVTSHGLSRDVVNRLRAMRGVRYVDAKNGRLLIDCTDGRFVPDIIRLLVSAGIEVESVGQPRTSLEDVFVSLMEAER